MSKNNSKQTIFPLLGQLDRHLARAFPAVIILFVMISVYLLMLGLGVAGYGDANIYHSYWRSIHAGHLPYVNLALEYPPGVIPIIVAAGLLGGVVISSYIACYVVLVLASLLWLLWHRLRVAGLQNAIILGLILLPVVQYVFFELDIFASISLYLAIWQLKRQRYTQSGIWLGVATLIKAYPAVCLAGLFWLIPRAARKTYLRAFLLTVLVVVVPLALIAPHGLWYSVTYHTGRPLEILSTPAGLGLISHFFGMPLHTIFNHKSMGLLFPHDRLLGSLSSFGLLLALLASFLSARRKAWAKQPALASMACLTAFMLLFKVGSPQYIVPIIILLPLTIDEISRRQLHGIAGRLFALGSLIAAQFYFYALHLKEFVEGHYIGWYAVVALLRMLLLAELLMYLIRLGQRKNRPNKAMRLSRFADIIHRRY